MHDNKCVSSASMELIPLEPTYLQCRSTSAAEISGDIEIAVLNYSDETYYARLIASPLFAHTAIRGHLSLYGYPDQNRIYVLTVIEYDVHVRASFVGVEKCYCAQLAIEHIASKGRLWRSLHQDGRPLYNEGRLTSTTFVRSRQSIQLTLNTPFC